MGAALRRDGSLIAGGEGLVLNGSGKVWVQTRTLL